MKKLLLLLLLLASSAYGEIFTWKDSTGTVHYTNSEYEIPERYRAKAKVLNLGIVEKKDNPASPQDATSQRNVTQQPSEPQLLSPVKPSQPPMLQRPAGNPMRVRPAEKARPGRSQED